MRVLPTASAATRRSRGRACARAIFRARLNVPFTTLVENGKLVAPERIKAAFAAGGVDLDQPVIASCGSGISAATMWLALDALGKGAESALRRLMGGVGIARSGPAASQPGQRGEQNNHHFRVCVK